MNYFIIGVSHHQAPVEIREKFNGITCCEAPLVRLVEQGFISEYLILSTCNRLEIMAATAAEVNRWRPEIMVILASVSELPIEDFQEYLYQYEGLGAVRHLFRVAASLDSLVLGEPQILGQVKESFRKALLHKHTGPFINKLMHKSFQAAKRVRTETSLAGGTVSVAGAAVALARSLEGGNLNEKDIMVLGAGPMATLAVAHLAKKEPRKLRVTNRNRSRAEILHTTYGAEIVPWGQLDEALAEVDVVICAVAVQEPILTQERLDPILARRKVRPLTIIDIGVPRNVAHSLKHDPQVVLKNIDDLNEVVQENQDARNGATCLAETIITNEVTKFGQWLEAQASRPMAAALSLKAEAIRRMELERTLSQQDFTAEQVAALEAMTTAMVRRLMHDPLIFIKNNNSNGKDCPGETQQDSLESLCRIFNLKMGKEAK